jgi:hypothetical protein
MVCNITTNTTEALNCLATRTEALSAVGYGFLAALCIIGFLVLVHLLNIPLFPNIKPYLQQGIYIIAGWLIAPLLNIGVIIGELHQNGLQSTFTVLYNTHIALMSLVTAIYFILFLMGLFWRAKL